MKKRKQVDRVRARRRRENYSEKRRQAERDRARMNRQRQREREIQRQRERQQNNDMMTESVVLMSLWPRAIKVARYSFSRPIPSKFEHKLRGHKQSFGKIATTDVLDKDENLL